MYYISDMVLSQAMCKVNLLELASINFQLSHDSISVRQTINIYLCKLYKDSIDMVTKGKNVHILFN